MKNEIRESDLELLSAWLDGECADPAAFRARLNAEPELALRLRQLQAVRARLATLAPPRPSADFAARVTERAYARRLSVPSRGFWWCALPVAAAALLLVVASLSHQTPPQEAAAPDDNAWRMALNAVAEAPDSEAAAEWVDEEAVPDETSSNDLVGALADLSTGEPGGEEFAEAGGLDAGDSVIDLMDQINEEDAAALAALLKPGA